MTSSGILHVLFFVGSFLPNSAFGAEISANLTPEQAGVMARARDLYGQDWRVMTSASDGKTSTVVLLGQAGAYSDEELEMAKRVVDQFEHFGVQGGDGKASFAHTPTELARLGPNTKSIVEMDDAANAVGPEGSRSPNDARAMPVRDMLAQGFTISSLSGAPAYVLTALWLDWAFATFSEVHSTMGPMLKGVARRKHSVRQIANFIARWTYVNEEHSPLVAIVRAPLLPRVEARLTNGYRFQAGQVKCGSSGCEVVAMP